LLLDVLGHRHALGRQLSGCIPITEVFSPAKTWFPTVHGRVRATDQQLVKSTLKSPPHRPLPVTLAEGGLGMTELHLRRKATRLFGDLVALGRPDRRAMGPTGPFNTFAIRVGSCWSAR